MKIRLQNLVDLPVLAQTINYCAPSLASHFGVSMRQLQRVFILKLGTSPHKQLRALRMNRAILLLSEKSPIKVIALELGYKYPEHFTREFKRHFGVAPTEYHSTVVGRAGTVKLRITLAFWALHSSFANIVPDFTEILMS